MSMSYGILGTYPPTQCGLATFSAALARALVGAADDVEIAAVVDEPEVHFAPEVTHQWIRGQRGGAVAVAQHLNGFDAVIVQHEYGIFGGRDGMDVLDVVQAVTVPVIVVFHTVLLAPSANQRRILVELARSCDVVVTMTWTARKRLIDQYGVGSDRVVVIPHGADATHVPVHAHERTSRSARPVVLTWGLLSQGKGIEWGIAAMALLRDLDPPPLYSIVGETHPKVLEWEGEAYRDRLVAEVQRLGVEDLVAFDARYLATSELRDIVSEADIVLLPYDSIDQVTSGVLVEAITAGKPLVSTPYPHAVELLGGGMGILVERRNPLAIADAVRAILTDSAMAERMSREALSVSPELLWPAVADRYRELASSIAEHEPVAVGS